MTEGCISVCVDAWRNGVIDVCMYVRVNKRKGDFINVTMLMMVNTPLFFSLPNLIRLMIHFRSSSFTAAAVTLKKEEGGRQRRVGQMRGEEKHQE